MLTTVQPIAFAELRQSERFSVLSHGLSSFFILIALSSIVPGTAAFISLLCNKNQNQNHSRFHSLLISNFMKLLYIYMCVPQNNTIFNNIKQGISSRIDWNIAVPERVFSQIIIYMGDIGSFFGFTDRAVKCCSTCLKKRCSTF